MADKEQLTILRKGVKAWGEWRFKNSPMGPDLSGANLRKADLHGVNLGSVQLGDASLFQADLREAKLMAADLTNANLNGADLRGADLSGADLTGATLEEANLRGANLSGANLTQATLHEANLRGANLSGSSLSQTDLSLATLASTIFADVDLSEAKGLDDVMHLGPSILSTDVIYKSKGKVPEIFLRGCGVPEDLISFSRAISGRRIESYSCFISYSTKDESFAKRVFADLQNKGVRVWFAPEKLKIGDRFGSKIDEAVRIYDKLLIVLSENSVNSPWVRREVQTALDKEKKEKRTVLFPIRLDDAFLDTTEDWADDIRRNRHVGDFKRWKEHDSYQTAFDRLLRDLKASEAK